MKSKQTAVEWYAEQDIISTIEFLEGKISQLQLGIKKIKILEQAKQMEKEQISEAYRIGVEEDVYNNPLKTGEQYYNETFNP